MAPLIPLVIFLLLSGPALGAESPAALDYTLKVSFDLSGSKIIGTATIPVPAGRELRLQIGSLRLMDIRLDGQRMEAEIHGRTVRVRAPRSGELAISYEGIFPSSPAREPLGPITSVISPRGISLTGLWYPQPEELAVYHLTAVLPPGYEAVSEAEEITKTVTNGRASFTFAFPHPVDGINLIASNRYRIFEDRHGRTRILAYFFPEEAELAPAYMARTKRYLELYERLVGPYPYGRFSVVENFLPTGISMPTFTLLGRDVVRLPFILETSLGHEILHQWFGNLVYIDLEKGNWAEGLTTYLADHLYAEQEGKGAEYRKGLLIDFQSYVQPGNDFPLRDFRGRTDFASKAVGYGKGLFVFHLLKRMVGEEAFRDALRSLTEEMPFRPAAWEDWQRSFESRAGRDLAWFFRQWVDGKGLADLRLEGVKAAVREDGWEVQFTVVQREGVYRLDLPVAFHLPSGKVKRVFPLDQERTTCKVLLQEPPLRVVIDEDYDLPRRLTPAEFPPVIARLLGAKNLVVVRPSSREEVYEGILEAFRQKGAGIRRAEEMEEADLGSASLILLGGDHPLAERLFGRSAGRGGFSVSVRENPLNPREVIGIFQGQSAAAAATAFPKIFHYGRYSELAFEQGRNVHRKTAESSRGITGEVSKEAVGVPVSALQNLPPIIDQVADRKIVYVGESHDQFSHHLVQLEVIRRLHDQGRKIAVGMEMFQRPFQSVLDDYIGGRIDEREMLRRTEYFRRWRFDYNLYRPILQFARAKKIPVMALNIPQEIVEKVSREGLDSLSAEEKRSVPAQMDFSDGSYRERLHQVFQAHRDLGVKDFNFFHQAQILWDETMAESVADYLSGHPEYQMVVLAGSGHLAFGSGIPRRAARRNGFSYVILLNGVELERGIADYVIYPGTAAVESYPRLMVSLEEEAGRVKITGFPPHSVSQKAGMQAGDILLSVDRTVVNRIEDLRIDLLFRRTGEPVKVKVLRKDPGEGERELEFTVHLH
ncbi:MAG: ChaN family lipoprotein [Deltaproteobacteria bacterium]|nr:ChaN family lipoprotein [Deltaproteobacteria bacterium]